MGGADSRLKFGVWVTMSCRYVTEISINVALNHSKSSEEQQIHSEIVTDDRRRGTMKDHNYIIVTVLLYHRNC